jgi:DNA-binding XRE family transcriptional regulator
MEKGKKQYVSHYLIIISQNVRKLRGMMSQDDFAKKVGISRATVHRIESCKNFQVESLLKIADSFGLLPYDLCLNDDDKKRILGSTEVLVESFKEIIKRDIIAELKKG